MKIRPYARTGSAPWEHGFEFWCPGCRDIHRFRTKAGPGADGRPARVWAFDGDRERPTFSPDLHYYRRSGHWIRGTAGVMEWSADTGPAITECRLYVSEGRIQYTDDCPHELRGMTVPMADLPEAPRSAWGAAERRRLSSTPPGGGEP